MYYSPKQQYKFTIGPNDLKSMHVHLKQLTSNV